VFLTSLACAVCFPHAGQKVVTGWANASQGWMFRWKVNQHSPEVLDKAQSSTLRRATMVADVQIGQEPSSFPNELQNNLDHEYRS
jgi:hypothetical protein